MHSVDLYKLIFSWPIDVICLAVCVNCNSCAAASYSSIQGSLPSGTWTGLQKGEQGLDQYDARKSKRGRRIARPRGLTGKPTDNIICTPVSVLVLVRGGCCLSTTTLRYFYIGHRRHLVFRRLMACQQHTYNAGCTPIYHSQSIFGFCTNAHCKPWLFSNCVEFSHNDAATSR